MHWDALGACTSAARVQAHRQSFSEGVVCILRWFVADDARPHSKHTSDSDIGPSPFRVLLPFLLQRLWPTRVVKGHAITPLFAIHLLT